MLNHPAVRDGALLLLRLALGVMFIAHGWKKVFLDGMGGLTGTVATFERLHVPQPGVTAWGAAGLEMLGGAMLIAGVLTTAAALVMAVYSGLIIYFVHLDKGFFVTDGGFEFLMVVIPALLMIVVFGAGRASVDRALSRFA